MKFSHVVPLAALTTAFVLPPEHVLSELTIEDHRGKSFVEEAVSVKDDIVTSFEEYFEDLSDKTKSAWHRVSQSSKSALDDALERAGDGLDALNDKFEEAADDMASWFDNEESDLLESFDDPHHGPPHHGPDHGRRPHHPKHPHHHKPNQTVYQMIASSKYTTTFAKLINEYPDLVETLNSTKANVTVFAPTNKAFEKIPEKAPKPSKEQLLAILQYHILFDAYPAFRVLSTHTAPTLLIGEHLGSGPQQQRVAFKLGLRGLTVNFLSRVVAVNIFGTNGVIHGVDSIILPPPSVVTIIDLFPGAYSTLELGLLKTGLLDTLNTTKNNGGTFFAPSNSAFERLGPRINAFLFSKYGEKYLKALLEYHVVPANTLYSDAYYKAESKDLEGETIPKGHFHVDLPTMLDDRSLSIDIARFGGFITMKINGFTSVAIQDVIAQNGVIQVLRSVLIPPKSVGGSEAGYDGGELSVDELKERLEPFVAKYDL